MEHLSLSHTYELLNEGISVPVTVINTYHKTDKGDATYIGRGSPLGNPWPITKDQNRDVVCDKYADWIYEKIQDTSSPQHLEIQRLIYLNRAGKDVQLKCFCAPKRCHGDTIKEIVERYT